MAGTQFIGKEPMLAAYSKVGDDLPWALFQGKKRRQAGTGADELNEWLDIFCPAGSTASYTLCVYSEDTDIDSITAGTDCLACWDFKLNDYRAEGAVGGLQKRLEDKITGMVIERLDKLEKKLDDDKETEEPEFDLNKIFMGWLQNPEQLGMVIGMVKNFFSRGGVNTMAPGAVGAVTPQGGAQTEEELYNRLSKVLDRLQVDNPGLIDQLEKLADIKEKKPDTFGFLLNSLNAV